MYNPVRPAFMSKAEKTFKYTQSYNKTSFREELEFAIDSADLSKFFQKALDEITKIASAPGFRKGKVPKNIVLTNYYSQIANKALEFAVIDYLSRIDNLDPIPIEPFTIQSIEEIENGSLKVVVSYLPMPSVKLGDFSKLPVKKPEAKLATKEEVDQELKNIWFFYAQKKDPQVNKDDYSEEKFTKEFFAESGITKDNPNINSYEKLRKFVEDYINNTYIQIAEADYENMIKKELINACDYFKIDGVIERELSKRVESYLNKFRQIGIDPYEYLKKSNLNLEELKQEWRKQIEQDIKFEILLQEYGVQNNITPTEEEILKELSKVDNDTKKMYNFDEERIRNLVRYRLINIKSYQELVDKIKSN